MAFKAIDDFVVKGILHCSKLKDMLKVFEDEYIKKSNVGLDGFRKLEAEWYTLEDKDVEQKIQQVLQSLEKNIYEFKDYTRIISLLIELELAGFQKDNTNSAIKKMQDNIFKSKVHVNLINGYGLLQEGEKKQRYNDIVEQLQGEIDRQFKCQITNTLEDYMKMEDGWGEKLKDYVYSNKAEICNNRGFLRQLDITKLCIKISKANSKDINSFRDCILSLYTRGIMGTGLEQDEEQLHEFRNGIGSINIEDFDKIKKLQIKYLISNLKVAEGVYSRD